MGCSTNTQPIQDLQYRYSISIIPSIDTRVKYQMSDEQDAGLRELILAISVGPPDTVKQLGKEADRVICLSTPRLFWAVGLSTPSLTRRRMRK